MMSTEIKTIYKFSDDVKHGIDQCLKKYPEDKRQSAVMEALTLVQNENGGWVSNTHIKAVSDYIGMPLIKVFEVATFCSLINLSFVGKYRIKICTNISCMLSDMDKIIKHLEKKLGIKIGETSKDGKYTLTATECIAACTKAPVMMINDTYYEELTTDNIDQIIDTLS